MVVNYEFVNLRSWCGGTRGEYIQRSPFSYLLSDEQLSNVLSVPTCKSKLKFVGDELRQSRLHHCPQV